MFFFIHAVFIFLQSKSKHFTRGSQTMKILVRQSWLLRQKWQILKMTLAQKNGHRIKTLSSKLMILPCHLAGKRILYAIMHTTFLFCPSFSWNYWSKVLHSFWATLYICKYSRSVDQSCKKFLTNNTSMHAFCAQLPHEGLLKLGHFCNIIPKKSCTQWMLQARLKLKFLGGISPKLPHVSISLYLNGPVHKRMNHIPKDVSERDSALSWFESLILPFVNAKLFQIRLLKRVLKRGKKGVLDRDPCRKPDSIYRTCERKALSERDSCVCILEMRAEAMHGSISTDCAVGTKYYLAVHRSCSWLGRRLQCMWMHVVQITIPITKRIAIRNVFRNVIRSFVNTANIHLSLCLQLSTFCTFFFSFSRQL